MTDRVAVVLAISALVCLASAQKPSNCPAHAVINHGVCIGKDGNDCSKQAQSSICYAPDPHYTQEALRANIKGIVRLTATVGTNGCAADIKVVGSLGYGLDESAVFALTRFRFRQDVNQPCQAVEFDFDPQLSSRNTMAGSKCEEAVADRSPTPK